MAHAAFDVADAVGRLHDVLGKLGALGEDRFEHVGRGVGKAGKIAVALVAEHVVEDEKRVLDGRLVDRHALSSESAFSAERAASAASADDHDRWPIKL